MPTTCCPNGYIYVSDTHEILDAFYNPGHVSGTLPSNLPGCYKLSNLAKDPVTGQWIGGIILSIPRQDPIDCPCCPIGYSYSSLKGTCVGDVVKLNTLPSIPCIPYSCVTPPPPLCDNCTGSTLPITFSFNPNIKNCINCNDSEAPVSSKDPNINTFIPIILIDPITNFTLD